MPAIAAKVKAENDAFYWHLGDFRWITKPDEDLIAMEHAGNPFSKESYRKIAWNDFLKHQVAPFAPLPVFLARGNHESVKPMTREGYIEKFASLLNRPEIQAQRKADGANAAPLGPWYHWTRNGVDFITLDNASDDEFSDAQLRWLRGVLERDEARGSAIRAIVVGMHEAFPYSMASKHSMEDWDLGLQTGTLVYSWLYEAQVAGKHVYIVASHSHYYSPNIFDTDYWKQRSDMIVPGWIIGSAGARRYKLPRDADKAAREHIYGYMQGIVHADGSIDFTLHELNENDLIQSRWPNAPLDAIHECYAHNADEW
jgi:Calcineurin-like phosphoesterase